MEATLLRDPDTLAAFVHTPGTVEATCTAVTLLVIGPASFAGDDWVLAADALDLTLQCDVADTATDLSTAELVAFATMTEPDAIVLDWSWDRAAEISAAIFEHPLARRTPVMILSDDGEASADRFRCGVWEDIAPIDFDDIVALLSAYAGRTALRRLRAQIEVLALVERLLSTSTGAGTNNE